MQQMATTVADTLAQQDPDNAQAYQDNAAQLDEELAALNRQDGTATRSHHAGSQSRSFRIPGQPVRLRTARHLGFVT